MFNISQTLLAIILAALSGVFMAVQGSLNSGLSKVTGLLEATLIVQLTGAAAILLIFAGKCLGKGCDFWAMFAAPWYAYLGGVIGVFIVYLVAASIPAVGVANATTAIIVGQVLTAIVIDHFGAFGLERMPCSWHQLLGLALLAIGARLLLKF